MRTSTIDFQQQHILHIMSNMQQKKIAMEDEPIRSTDLPLHSIEEILRIGILIKLKAYILN